MMFISHGLVSVAMVIIAILALAMPQMTIGLSIFSINLVQQRTASYYHSHDFFLDNVFITVKCIPMRLKMFATATEWPAVTGQL